MDRGILEVGDKVICLYRKGNFLEGRVHLGYGVITHMSMCGLGPYFYSIKLDRGDKTITVTNMKPHGAVIPYSEEMDDEMRILHDHHMRTILAIEDDYFEKLGGK